MQTFNTMRFFVVIFTSLLILGSCEKEQFSPVLTSKKNSGETRFPSNYRDVVLATPILEKLHHSLTRDLTSKSSSSKLDSILSDIISQPARSVKSLERNTDIYTFFIPTENPLVVANLVLEIIDEEVENGYVNVFNMTPDFATLFNAMEADFNSFSGSLRVIPIEQLENLIYLNHSKSNENDCFVLTFNPPSPPNGGGGVNDNNNVGVINEEGGGSIINWSGSGYVGIIGGPGYVPGGAWSNNTGIGGNSGNTNPPSTGMGIESCSDGSLHYYEFLHLDTDGVMIVQKRTCATGSAVGSPTRLEKSLIVKPGGKGGKSLSVDECGQLFSIVGIVPRRLSSSSMSAHTQERLESAISETCFDHNAIMHIINIPDFEACFTNSQSPSDCVKNQVVDHLNESGVGADPNSPLSIGFDNLPHDQLAIFFHALIASNNNEHALAGINFALWNLNNSHLENLLVSTILQASILSLSEPSNFEANSTAFISILNKTEGELSVANTTWLMENPSILRRLSQNDIAPDITKDLAEIYIKLYETNTDFKKLADYEFEAINPILWAAIKEIGVEIAIELAFKYIPGFNQINNLKDAVKNAAQGDIIGFLGEVLDIVRGFARNIPILAGISIALDGIELTAKASGAWRAIAKMDKIGGEFAEKILDAVQRRGNSILDSFKWKGRGVGASLDGLPPEQFFDDLQALFPNANPLSPSQLQAQEVAGFKSGNLRVAIKFGGNTHPNGWTLEARKGSNVYKIRFDFNG